MPASASEMTTVSVRPLFSAALMVSEPAITYPTAA